MTGKWKTLLGLALAAAAAFFFSACGSSPENDLPLEGEKIRVVVTTTFIADVVENIAGEDVETISLLTAGQNPHSYQPSPMDMVAISEADLILANGFGLEEYLDDLISGSASKAELVVVSQGIAPLVAGEHADNDHDDDPLEAGMGLDPHVWLDPTNIMVWTGNIAGALGRIDPENRESYLKNAGLYLEQLETLDSWIRDQVAQLPAEQRVLVTDHTTLAYFADEYGLEQVGAVIPALTTEAETSGMELAELIDTIEEYQVRAIFVGVDFDPTLAQRVAEETGVELKTIYFGSLSDGEPAGTYLSFMRYNVSVILDALD